MGVFLRRVVLSYQIKLRRTLRNSLVTLLRKANSRDPPHTILVPLHVPSLNFTTSISSPFLVVCFAYPHPFTS